MCVWGVAQLPQSLKSMFFEKISSLRDSFLDPPFLEKISKSIDFSLLGKQCCTIILPAKWIFFRVLDHLFCIAM